MPTFNQLVRQGRKKVEYLGESKYLVHYNDMGNKGVLTISTVVENNEILFDKIISSAE